MTVKRFSLTGALAASKPYLSVNLRTVLLSGSAVNSVVARTSRVRRRVAEVNDQQGAVGIAAQILVLLKIGVG